LGKREVGLGQKEHLSTGAGTRYSDPVTHYPENVDQLAKLHSLTPPFALKPAIKEHFFYATKAKAWRANSHSELRTLFQKASELAGYGEIMVQELIPGGGSQQFSYCAFFRKRGSSG
jgi:D-aspartate ligase